MRHDTDSNEKTPTGISGDWQHPKSAQGIVRTLVFTFLGLTLGLLLFQLLKHLLFPEMTLWDSHLMTNIVGSIAGTIAMYLVQRSQMRSYRQLQVVEAQYRTLVEMSPDAICLATLDGTIVMCNAQALRLHGISDPAEVIGKSAFTFFAPEELEHAHAELKRAIVLGRTHVVEYTLIRPDGSRYPAEVSSAIIPDARGNPALIVTIAREITEHIQAQQQIQRLLEHVELRAAEMDTTITAMADGMVVYGTEGEITRINRAAEEIMGYDADIESRPLAERITTIKIASTDDVPLKLAEVPHMCALRGEVVKNMVVNFTRSDGQQRSVSMSAAPIRNQEGELRGAVLSLSDVTSLRTLQQQQENLLYVVSHDLRLPLTIIHGHMELLTEALGQYEITSQMRMSVSTITRNVQRLNNMIADLVDMTRLEGQQFTISLSDIALQHYMPDLLARLQQILPVHRVIIDIPADLPSLRVDDGRLERIILNLLTNAFKYSTEETIVRIKAYRQHHEVVLSVTDQGRGFAPEQLTHIFERFSLTTGKQRTDSVGLGLYIVKLMVEAQGGHIWVESTLGQGSTFYCAFPVASSVAYA